MNYSQTTTVCIQAIFCYFLSNRYTGTCNLCDIDIANHDCFKSFTNYDKAMQTVSFIWEKHNINTAQIHKSQGKWKNAWRDNSVLYGHVKSKWNFAGNQMVRLCDS